MGALLPCAYMPAPKKQSAIWYIAATHYLTAGFAIPFVGGLVLGFVHYYALPTPNDLVTLSMKALESVILTYLGVMYGAKYVNKTYVITDASKIVKLSTKYFVSLSVFWWALTFFFLSQLPEVSSAIVSIGVATTVASIVVFYFASKKYIRAGQ